MPFEEDTGNLILSGSGSYTESTLSELVAAAHGLMNVKIQSRGARKTFIFVKKKLHQPTLIAGCLAFPNPGCAWDQRSHLPWPQFQGSQGGIPEEPVPPWTGNLGPLRGDKVPSARRKDGCGMGGPAPTTS